MTRPQPVGPCRRALCAAALCALALAPVRPAAAAAERGRLGFTVYVEVDGDVVTPILKSVRVQEVEPGSPADVGGLRVHDAILQVQGRPLAGANAREVAAMVQVPPGTRLRLLVRSPGGAQRRVTIVAGPPVGRRH